jgi:hypothetical protein
LKAKWADMFGPPSRLRRFGVTAFAGLAKPKLTLRRVLA